MSINTRWKVTVAVMKIETREIYAVSKEEARELAEQLADADKEGMTVLDVEWIDPEAA